MVDPPVHHVDVQTREPMVVELGDLLFVTGFPRLPHTPPRAPNLWRSDDAGRTWEAVDVGTPSDGAIGNSDVDLAVGPDGTLYFLTMGFNRTTGEGTHVSVGVSHDRGAAWTWTQLSDTRLDDRPWIDVAPNGTARVIWNDGSGVCHAVSTDRGMTWSERPRIHPRGGSSHLAIGPNGEVAVRITPHSASGNRVDPQTDLLAVSLDDGLTWLKHALPGSRSWSESVGGGPVPRWVEPIAWDADGSLYYLWSEGETVWLAQSRDRGETWSRWPIHESPSVAFYPYLVARGSGELAATWFSSSDSLRVHAALIIMSGPETDVTPSVLLAGPVIPDAWNVTDDGDRIGDTAGEYIPITFLSDGDLAIVTPLQDSATNRYGFTWWRIRVR